MITLPVPVTAPLRTPTPAPALPGADRRFADTLAARLDEGPRPPRTTDDRPREPVQADDRPAAHRPAGDRSIGRSDEPGDREIGDRTHESADVSSDALARPADRAIDESSERDAADGPNDTGDEPGRGLTGAERTATAATPAGADVVARSGVGILLLPAETMAPMAETTPMAAIGNVEGPSLVAIPADGGAGTVAPTSVPTAPALSTATTVATPPPTEVVHAEGRATTLATATTLMSGPPVASTPAVAAAAGSTTLPQTSTEGAAMAASLPQTSVVGQATETAPPVAPNQPAPIPSNGAAAIAGPAAPTRPTPIVAPDQPAPTPAPAPTATLMTETGDPRAATSPPPSTAPAAPQPTSPTTPAPPMTTRAADPVVVAPPAPPAVHVTTTPGAVATAPPATETDAAVATAPATTQALAAPSVARTELTAPPRLAAVIAPEAARLRGTSAHRTLEVRLDPPDLGTVDLEIRSSGSTVSVVARTESADAMLAVLRQRDAIEASLRQLGLDLSGFDVSAGTPERDQHETQRSRPGARSGGSESAELDAATAAPTNLEGSVFL